MKPSVFYIDLLSILLAFQVDQYLAGRVVEWVEFVGDLVHLLPLCEQDLRSVDALDEQFRSQPHECNSAYAQVVIADGGNRPLVAECHCFGLDLPRVGEDDADKFDIASVFAFARAPRLFVVEDTARRAAIAAATAPLLDTHGDGSALRADGDDDPFPSGVRADETNVDDDGVSVICGPPLIPFVALAARFFALPFEFAKVALGAHLYREHCRGTGQLRIVSVADDVFDVCLSPPKWVGGFTFGVTANCDVRDVLHGIATGMMLQRCIEVAPPIIHLDIVGQVLASVSSLGAIEGMFDNFVGKGDIMIMRRLFDNLAVLREIQCCS